MKQLMVIEDGTEYLEFAERFLAHAFVVRGSRSAREAFALLSAGPADGFLLDLRFERSPDEDLLGDVSELAERRFAGVRDRAAAYLREQQGAIVLAALREAGHDAPAVFVHDFPPRRLENLRKLYGRVDAVASFDARRIEAALGGSR